LSLFLFSLFFPFPPLPFLFCFSLFFFTLISLFFSAFFPYIYRQEERRTPYPILSLCRVGWHGASSAGYDSPLLSSV
jgi:hypothetical protein